MGKLLGRMLFPTELYGWKKVASGLHSEVYINKQKTLVRQVTTEYGKKLYTLDLLPSIEGIAAYPQAVRIDYNTNAMLLEMPKYSTLPSLGLLSTKQRELIFALKQFSIEFCAQTYAGDMAKRIREDDRFSPDVLAFLAASVEAYGNYHSYFTFDYAIRNVKYYEKTAEVILLDIFYSRETLPLRRVLSEIMYYRF